MRSSYIRNNYGKLLYDFALTWRPKVMVELGVLDGYSTMHLAKAVGAMHPYVNQFDAYDLFDEYRYKHGNYDAVRDMLYSKNLDALVELRRGDAFTAHKVYKKYMIDFMHIDISNDGDVLIKVLNLWLPKLSRRSVVLFEGGSVARDNVDWMVRYNKTPIRKVLNEDPWLNDNFVHYTYERYPSLTALIRKVPHERFTKVF